MLLNLQKYFILLKVPGSFWLAELTSCNISARAEPSHFTLELLEPKLMNEPGRATEKPARGSTHPYQSILIKIATKIVYGSCRRWS